MITDKEFGNLRTQVAVIRERSGYMLKRIESVEKVLSQRNKTIRNIGFIVFAQLLATAGAILIVELRLH